MFIIRRFVLRMLFAPFGLVVMLICLAVLLAMMAIAFVSVGCLGFAAVFGLGYWVRHDPVLGRNALEALAYSVGSFSVLVAFQGMIWDGISAMWRWATRSPTELQLRQPSAENFAEIPFDGK